MLVFGALFYSFCWFHCFLWFYYFNCFKWFLQALLVWVVPLVLVVHFTSSPCSFGSTDFTASAVPTGFTNRDDLTVSTDLGILYILVLLSLQKPDDCFFSPLRRLLKTLRHEKRKGAMMGGGWRVGGD